MDIITHSFLNFQVALKIYHWQTLSYPRHIASDGLFQKISLNIDKFVEILQGSRNERIKFNNNEVIRLRNFSEKNGLDLLYGFKDWLENELSKYLNIEKETDLINLRDEMIGDLNQTLYLFSLN